MLAMRRVPRWGRFKKIDTYMKVVATLPIIAWVLLRRLVRCRRKVRESDERKYQRYPPFVQNASNRLRSALTDIKDVMMSSGSLIALHRSLFKMLWSPRIPMLTSYEIRMSKIRPCRRTIAPIVMFGSENV
jgi:hypothetical protein